VGRREPQLARQQRDGGAASDRLPGAQAAHALARAHAPTADGAAAQAALHLLAAHARRLRAAGRRDRALYHAARRAQFPGGPLCLASPLSAVAGQEQGGDGGASQSAADTRGRWGRQRRKTLVCDYVRGVHSASVLYARSLSGTFYQISSS